MKAALLTKCIFFLILFSININNLYPNQLDNSTETNLEFVQVGGINIEKADWDGLKIQKGLPVKFGFSAEGIAKFRIFLDGDILETNLIGNEYTLNELNTGIHILRIIPILSDGNIGKPLVYSFSVIEEAKPTVNEIEAGSSNETTINNILFFVAAGIILFQLIVIVFLLIKKKGNKVDNNEKNHALHELSDLRQSYRRIIDEIKNHKEENEHLRRKIKELNTNIELLEEVNVNLLKQKEKLSESKRKLELLHTQKEELFAIAIHDIKNPAAAIQGYIQLLNSYELNANEQHEIMVSLASSSENIVKLSQNMCEIIAKSMPEPKLGLAQTSLVNIINDVCNQNLSYAKTKKVKLLNKASRDLPDVMVDAEKIQEALDNYVNNAIKYALPDTVVEVRSFVKQSDKKKIIVEVSDNGVGLSEEDMAKCFQKGVILSSQPTGFEQSSGLGLWIVKRIVEDHHGKVWVDSKLGAGSTFGFELPLQ